MGRKYRALKEALRNNPVRDLLVIDDWKLRLKLFAEAEAVIKKIDKVERDRDNFSNQDQRLFTDWYELTFRQEKKELEERHQEYIALAKLHNDIIAVAEMQDIPPHRAYLFLKEEEKRYQAGTDSQRAEIDKLRQERLEFAQKAMDEEYGSAADEDEDFEDFLDEMMNEKVDVSDLRKEDRLFYQHLKSADPAQLREEFSGAEELPMARSAIWVASMVEDSHLLVKIWDLLSAKTQRHLSKDFKKNTGGPMEDFINSLRNTLSREAFNASRREDDPEDSENGFFDGFIQSPRKQTFTLSENAEQELKLIFRKLARLIHPDSQDPQLSESLKTWYQKVWQQVQEAYKAKNLQQLKKLEIMATIRLKELNSLTFAEIKASTHWLEEELAELRASLKSLEKHPAWKFSTKRSYETLIKKIKKEFESNLAPLLKDIDQLKELHHFYERASNSNPNLRTSGRKRKAKKRPSRNVKRKNSPQMSLFD